MSDAVRRWSTEDARPGEALGYWVDAICEAFLEMKADSTDRTTFAASIEQHPFGPVDLNFADTTAQKVWRTPHAIAGSRKHACYLLYMREGGLAARQRGREAAVHPGDCVLIDGMQPYSFSFPGTNRCLSIQMPHNWLSNWVPSTDRVVATNIASSDWGRTLASAVGNLARRNFDDLVLPRATVADQLGALIALAAGGEAAAEIGRGENLLREIRDTLLQRLGEAALDPAAVAAAHGISLRYLHLLFAKTGASFGATLTALRLERAKHLLDDPRLSRLSVGEIAWRCGFHDPSHFARRFRARYGAAPASYRRILHA